MSEKGTPREKRARNVPPPRPLPSIGPLPKPKKARRKHTKQPKSIRLNVGGGAEIPGYELVDRANGKEAYPLDYPDNSVDEVRASHILEHFGYADTLKVVKDWVRVLKPGGVLKIAVPDFEFCIREYAKPDSDEPVEGYILGGQIDENDFHKAIFTRRQLFLLLNQAGLIDINKWASQIQDCASLPVSLNLRGTKPEPGWEVLPVDKRMSIHAAMSVPRLGFMDNFFTVFQSLPPLGIQMKKYTGAFWGQCLQTCMEDIGNDPAGYEAILTLDYDTVCTAGNVARLSRLMQEHPEADAITVLQSQRTRPSPLLTIIDEETGGNASQIEARAFEKDLLRIRTGHFGLTLIRMSSLKDLPKPWFHGVPNQDGEWREDRIDADIYFWREWEKAGKTLYLATRIAIGHCELMVSWPDQKLQTIHQHMQDFVEGGRPEDAWV